MKKAIEMTTQELAQYIDYSVLKPEFTKQQILDLTKDGVELGCATICINPAYVEMCEPLVKGTTTMLCPVCDFPFGTSSTESKVKQAEILCRYETVKEVDIVSNYGLIRSGEFEAVYQDVKAVIDMCHSHNKPVKVIFETDALTIEEIKKMCEICVRAKADFVKTSTGFLTGHDLKGGYPELIKMMIDEVDGKCKVKASGSIRGREKFLTLIDMGVNRMGIGYRSVPVVLDLVK
jgi:deoxyribose-phosphate aldolase